MEEARVYCIVVTYNGMRWIQKCLQCLAESDYPVYTIVIDNGSTDGTASFIQNQFPGVHLTITQKNLGFGKATNMGMFMALQKDATHILLLNQDVYVEKSCVGKLVTAQAAHPEYGILSPVQLTGSGADFDGNFYRYLVQSKVRPLLLSALVTKHIDEEIIEAKFVCGAAWMLTRACIEKVGGFDPAFFFYGEDDNYVHRASYHHFKTGILPSSFICHDRNLSTSQFHSNNTLHLRRDSTILLSQACNPNQESYKSFLAKRLLRHSLSGIVNILILKKKTVAYHFSMAKFIAGSYKKIRHSRHIVKTQIAPYLVVEAS